MNMDDNVPWKEAATLIIAAKTPLKNIVGVNLASALVASKSPSSKQSRCDYNLLMVKRSNLSSFMASAFVFPGGLAEIQDFAPAWWNVFSAQGVDRKDIEKFCSRVKGPRPEMTNKPVTLSRVNVTERNDYLPADVALRIVSIREAFEETGIPILTRSTIKNKEEDLIPETVDLVRWRQKIREDSAAFADFCLEANVCPDIWALHEWWDWLTPTSVGHKRYDTMFYICCMESQPAVELDQGEVITYRWGSPEEILEEHCTSAAFLAPPQVYELSRLIHLKNYQTLEQFARYRSTMGVQRWMPVLCCCKDGALSLLPGDEMYPANPDYIGKRPGKDIPKTIEELRVQCQAKRQMLHRMEVCGACCTIYSNVLPTHGHIKPITYRSVNAVIQSYL